MLRRLWRDPRGATARQLLAVEGRVTEHEEIDLQHRLAVDHIEARPSPDRVPTGLRIDEEARGELPPQSVDVLDLQPERKVDVYAGTGLAEDRAGQRAAEQPLDPQAIECRRDLEQDANRLARQLSSPRAADPIQRA